jgi:hypothetical protein
MQLVGNRQGKKVVRWGRVLLSGFIYTTIAAVAAAGIFLLVAKQWNSTILLVGPAVGLVATLSSLLVSLFTPVHQLPMLTWYPK